MKITTIMCKNCTPFFNGVAYYGILLSVIGDWPSGKALAVRGLLGRVKSSIVPVGTRTFQYNVRK